MVSLQTNKQTNDRTKKRQNEETKKRTHLSAQYTNAGGRFLQIMGVSTIFSKREDKHFLNLVPEGRRSPCR
jgi:hypothetical protein